ncbi:MAG: TonB-dependent receptor, partial [Saprospiraceae bacterium]|nr:TonB-dependent receptor [Saprospiraceae bacterium]
MTIQTARFWSAVCFVCSSALWLGAQHCDIPLRGIVWNADTGEPLAYASVQITGTNRGALTDENGAFLLGDLCEDSTYTVTVSHIECDHETQVIRLVENKVFHFYLHHHVLSEVVVQERAVAPLPAQASEALSGEALTQRQALPLGEALRQLPGVSVLNTGTTIAKPVIHGLHSNRIAIVSNGVTLEGQQWGTEHAPEVDLFTAQRISVVKGAAGVRYGVGAIAGAVVLEPAPLRQRPGASGWLYGSLNSNGWGSTIAGAADWKPRNGSLALRLQAAAKRSGNLRAPDYWLGNTGMEELNFSALAEGNTGRWRHESALSRFAQRIGILQAAHIGNLTDLQRAIESPVPLNNDNRFRYDIGRPFQRIQHYTARHRVSRPLSDRWKFSTQYALQFNLREEYDIVRRTGSAANKPQQRFRIWTHMLDAAVEHAPIYHWEGGVGGQLIYQYNLVGRGGLIPDYQSWGGSLWWLERWRHFPKPWELELGLRYDYRRTAASTTGTLYNVD